MTPPNTVGSVTRYVQTSKSYENFQRIAPFKNVEPPVRKQPTMVALTGVLQRKAKRKREFFEDASSTEGSEPELNA